MLATIDFEEETKGKSTNDKLQQFYDLLESTAVLIFKKKKKYLNDQEEEKKTINKIPKRVRELMKPQKKPINKNTTQENELDDNYETEEVEMEIEKEYKARKAQHENKAISKLKNVPKFFYSYTKKHSKSKN